VTVFTWIYLGLLAVALATEAVAIAVKDKPDQRNTITANIRWLVQLHGAWWHTASRVLLIALLGWLPGHFLS